LSGMRNLIVCKQSFVRTPTAGILQAIAAFSARK
jgi:hypothetical protein